MKSKPSKGVRLLAWLRSFSLRAAPSRFWAGLYVLACMVGIFYLSSLPSHDLPGWGPSEWTSTLGHIVAYGSLAWFVILFLHRFEMRGVQLAAMVLAFVCLYGITDEIHQSFVPTRNPSVSDVMADCFGGCLALWFWKKSG